MLIWQSFKTPLNLARWESITLEDWYPISSLLRLSNPYLTPEVYLVYGTKVDDIYSRLI